MKQGSKGLYIFLVLLCAKLSCTFMDVRMPNKLASLKVCQINKHIYRFANVVIYSETLVILTLILALHTLAPKVPYSL